MAQALLNRITAALCRTLEIEEINEIILSFHIYPEDWEAGGPGPAGSRLYPDLEKHMERRRAAYVLKRSLDVLGSLAAWSCYRLYS